MIGIFAWPIGSKSGAAFAEFVEDANNARTKAKVKVLRITD
jgi:hypothetical protein